MKICFLTQTARDISPEYKDFFKGRDIFFVTFKEENEKALKFVPKSTWSDGRNCLWEQVRDKYDYYVFIDDDLKFLKLKVSISPLIAFLAHKLLYRGGLQNSYEEATPAYFFSRLEHYLAEYRPEVLSTQSFFNASVDLDTAVMRKNSFVRRLGWFDAQFTVLSNYAASKLLPYDTKFSGWWSSQVPIYLYAFNVFGQKAISVADIATINTFHVGEYVPGYNGNKDVENMLTELSAATGKQLTGDKPSQNAYDSRYGADEILVRVPQPNDTEDYAVNYKKTLKGIEKVLHKNLDYK